MVTLKNISLFLFLMHVTFITSQNKVRESTTRAVQREVPLTNSILNALDEGTRDFTGRPGANYWQLETDYTINVSLDPGTQVLSGSETILVHNNSNSELIQIVLRLDHNIFRADVPRGYSVPAETTEGMILTRLNVNGEEVNLMARSPSRRGAAAQEPRNRISGLHKTVATISLVNPIQPKSTATVEIDWHTKLPGGPNGSGHRMTQRWEDRLFQPTQWYPRLAKYDDLRGWQTDVYLGPAEFFNNFGSFDVKIDVPGGWIVSGTGVLQNPEEVLTDKTRERLSKVLDSNDEITIVGEDERGQGKGTALGESLIWHFKADKVNDFAWATSNEYIWKATRATIPTKGAIPIHMLYLPERAHLFERAADLSRHALEFYSELWAPYAFPQLTLQDGPSAGMEYPMVINSNQGAADHEVAHQWWPMMLGTNEARYGWMDEGFNTYMNILSAADRKKQTPNLDGVGQRYGRISGNEDEPPMMWNANYAGDFYGFQTYVKASQMLSMLGAIVGDEAVQNAMSNYAKVWSFKHPSPWDYIFFMNNELDQDLEWFWYYWLWTTESVDGSIQNVTNENGQTVVTIHQAGQMPSPVVLKVEFENDESLLKAMPNSEILDKNTVIVNWPAEVWFNGERTFNASLDFGTKKIKKIIFDPNGRFPDNDPDDNVWPRD